MRQRENDRMRTLRAQAPIHPRGVFVRDGDRFLLCGTIGPEFDFWQRRLASLGAADALFSQNIGLEAVEKEMDDLEEEIRGTLGPGEKLAPRKSPGYGEMPLEYSREIIEKTDATRRIGVSMTDSLLLAPSKSVTAVCEVLNDRS